MSTLSVGQGTLNIANPPRQVEKTSVWKKPTTWGELDFFLNTILPSLVRQQPKEPSTNGQHDRFERMKNILVNVLFDRPAHADRNEPLPPHLQATAADILAMEGGLEAETLGDKWRNARVAIGNWTRHSLRSLTSKAR